MRILEKQDKKKEKTEKTMMQSMKRILPQIALPLGIGLLIIIFYLITPQFITPYNISNIARQLVTLLLLAGGITYVLVSGGVDLSIGSNMALVSVITALVLLNTSNVALAITIGLLTGVALGAINGTIIAKLHVQSFAVTLGTMSIASGAAMLLSNGNTVRGLPDDLEFLSAIVAGVPVQVIITIVIIAIMYILLQKTPYGSYLYATGGNERTAILSGVKVAKVKIIAYTVCGFAAALAAIIATSRSGTGQPTLGTDMGLQAIAAAIIGGASMSGGRGSMKGTIFGVLFITILYSGLNFTKVSSFAQDVLIGLIIIGSAWLDVSRRKRIG